MAPCPFQSRCACGRRSFSGRPSSSPSPRCPDLGTGLGTWDLALRKLAHAAEFALLGALLLRAVRVERTALALGIAYAVSDELHQHFVAGRVGSPVDVLIDSVGVALGVALYRRLGR